MPRSPSSSSGSRSPDASCSTSSRAVSSTLHRCRADVGSDSSSHWVSSRWSCSVPPRCSVHSTGWSTRSSPTGSRPTDPMSCGSRSPRIRPVRRDSWSTRSAGCLVGSWSSPPVVMPPAACGSSWPGTGSGCEEPSGPSRRGTRENDGDTRSGPSRRPTSSTCGSRRHPSSDSRTGCGGSCSPAPTSRRRPSERCSRDCSSVTPVRSRDRPSRSSAPRGSRITSRSRARTSRSCSRWLLRCSVGWGSVGGSSSASS